MSFEAIPSFSNERSSIISRQNRNSMSEIETSGLLPEIDNSKKQKK